MAEENLGRGAPSRPRTDGANWADALPSILVIAYLGAAAVVPDEAILRSKVVWTEVLMLAAATAALVGQLSRSRFCAPWPLLLVGSVLPGAIALLLTLTRTDLISRALARDEVERLLLFPLAFWCVGSTLSRPAVRRIFLGALSISLLLVAGLAVAQNLAGELQLPVNRFERPPSTFGNPVFLGAFLVLVMPISVAEALFTTGWRRWAGSLASGLALPALLATQSRWAWLAAGVAVCVGTVLLSPPGRWRRWLLVGLVGAVAVVLLLNPAVIRRPQQHALIWRDTLAMASDHPWGIGPGQFPVAFLDYASAELLAAYPPTAFVINDAHNEPLELLAELGWPGLAAVALLGLLLLRLVARSCASADAGADRPQRVACLAALSGALVQSFGSPDLRFVVSMLMLGSIAGLAASFDGPRVLTVRGPRVLRVVLVLVVLLAGGWALRATASRVQVAELLLPAPPVQAALAPGDSAAVVARMRAQVAATPRDAAAHYGLGLALATERRYAEAAECFRSALVLQPENRSVIRSLGVSEGLSGQFAPAAHHLRLALEAEPDNVELRYLYAYACWRRGDINTSITALETLLAARPDHRQARLLLEKLRE